MRPGDADGHLRHLRKSRPQDLLKFGLIPEFVGRLPVITSVSPLDHDALVQILSEPKNALVKQYRRLFEIDNVELEFTDDAIDAIADQAMVRDTGARGLRAIMEEVLLNVMYEVPCRDDVAKVVVNGEVVLENVNPTLIPRDQSDASANAARSRRSPSGVQVSMTSAKRRVWPHLTGLGARHAAGVATAALVTATTVAATAAVTETADATAAGSAAVHRCMGRVATIVGTQHNDQLTGTAGRDVIVGLRGWDKIDAGAGRDIICGNRGSDRVVGGRGADSLSGGADAILYGEDQFGDRLTGGPGDDRIDGGPGIGRHDRGLDTVDYRHAPHRVHLSLARRRAVIGRQTDTVISIETVYGSRHADRLTGDRRYQEMDGYGGRDRIVGRGGIDFLSGDAGADVIFGGDGIDYLDGEHGRDIVAGNRGDDVINGQEGSDRLFGGRGADRLYGDVYGVRHGGRDRIHGGRGDDYLSGGPAVDLGHGGPSTRGDTCRSIEHRRSCER